MIPQKNVAPAVFEPATSWNCQKKKSACKINENDLKIAWKCTLRQSSFKNFQDPLIRGELSYSPPLAAYATRYMPSAVNAPPRHTHTHSWLCRIMNEFFMLAFGGWGGGWECHPPLPLPHPIHIYLCGCGGWRDRQVIQDSTWLALVIKPAGIIFAA